MAKKCVHKGCGKVYNDENEECVYHPGPPVFHEGQKGWKCCKPRVLTFDEFLTIPPCTTGKHSEVDDTPAPETTPTVNYEDIPKPQPVPASAEPALPAPVPRLPTSQAQPPIQPGQSASPAPPEDESDDPSLPIEKGATCRRKGCNATYNPDASRESEECVHHPGFPIFHEGSKGYSCCKRRVLEFDEFMKMEGCKTKNRHLFVGKGKNGGEEASATVRHDFYQTPTSVIASLYLKKIDKAISKVEFASPTSLKLDLRTSDSKRYNADWTLYAPIETEKSQFKIMGTKLEFNLTKADGASWAVLRADDPLTGEIIQVGRAGKV